MKHRAKVSVLLILGWAVLLVWSYLLGTRQAFADLPDCAVNCVCKFVYGYQIFPGQPAVPYSFIIRQNDGRWVNCKNEVTGIYTWDAQQQYGCGIMPLRNTGAMISSSNLGAQPLCTIGQDSGTVELVQVPGIWTKSPWLTWAQQDCSY
jgi:hypothetical protein